MLHSKKTSGGMVRKATQCLLGSVSTPQATQPTLVAGTCRLLCADIMARMLSRSLIQNQPQCASGFIFLELVGHVRHF